MRYKEFTPIACDEFTADTQVQLGDGTWFPVERRTERFAVKRSGHLPVFDNEIIALRLKCRRPTGPWSRVVLTGEHYPRLDMQGNAFIYMEAPRAGRYRVTEIIEGEE